MGVDYSAHYGIGIKIQTFEIEDKFDFLDENLNEKYTWFETGEGSYTGEENEFYVILKDDSNLLEINLSVEKVKLLNHLKEIGIETIGEFGIVGGLEIY